MIKIRRSACPAALRGKTAKGTHYNKRGVVLALWKMQHGKCCYCERELPEKGHLKAVEHFRPKAVFKGLKNEWANLLLACSQCNGKKADKFPEVLSDRPQEDKVLYLDAKRPAIIDPSHPQIDPEDHIDYDFSGDEHGEDFAVIMAKNESVLGKKTIRAIGLAGGFYTRVRRYHFRWVVLTAYRDLLEALDSDRKQQIRIQRESFQLLMASDKPFAGFVRSFARFKHLDGERAGLKIPKGS